MKLERSKNSFGQKLNKRINFFYNCYEIHSTKSAFVICLINNFHDFDIEVQFSIENLFSPQKFERESQKNKIILNQNLI